MRSVELSRFARELALERGVSERTAWRWLARLRAGGTLPEADRLCEACDRELPEGATIARRFCEDACRVWAHRRAKTRMV